MSIFLPLIDTSTGYVDAIDMSRGHVEKIAFRRHVLLRRGAVLGEHLPETAAGRPTSAAMPASSTGSRAAAECGTGTA
jgi:hypothetical protein